MSTEQPPQLAAASRPSQAGKRKKVRGRVRYLSGEEVWVVELRADRKGVAVRKFHSSKVTLIPLETLVNRGRSQGVLFKT